MDITTLIVWLLAVIAIADGIVINRHFRPQMRRRTLGRRKNNVIYTGPSQTGSGSGSSGGKSLTQNIQIRNLPLAPGQSKVIRQTLIVRRRGGQPGSRNHGGSGPRTSRPLVIIRPTNSPVSQPQTQNPFSGGSPRRVSIVSSQGNRGHGIGTISLPILSIDQFGNVLSSGGRGGRPISGGAGSSHGSQPSPVNNVHAVDVFISAPNPNAPAGQPIVGGTAQVGHSNLNIAHTGINHQTGQRVVRVHLGNGQHIIYTSNVAPGPQPTMRSRQGRTTVPTTVNFPTTLKAGEDPPENKPGREPEI